MNGSTEYIASHHIDIHTMDGMNVKRIISNVIIIIFHVIDNKHRLDIINIFPIYNDYDRIYS